MLTMIILLLISLPSDRLIIGFHVNLHLLIIITIKKNTEKKYETDVKRRVRA